MSVGEGTSLLLAVALGVAGLACLFAGWRRRIPAHWRPVPAGWGLLVLSGGFWVAAAGAEFGISLVLLFTPVLAWLFVAANRRRRGRRGRRKSGAPEGGHSIYGHLLRFLLVVPMAAVTSALGAVAVSLALPVSTIDAMVVVLVVMPLLWGCAAYWACADSHVVRPAAAMLIGAAVSAAVIYV